jgi:hypothetical protein
VAQAQHPIDPEQLLVVAEALAPAKPREGPAEFTERRRAVSTAYYAVFHAISRRVAATVFPSADEIFRQRISRWIAHTDIRTVARWVVGLQGTGSGQGVPSHIRELLAGIEGPLHIDTDTVTIAEGFLELHEKRDQADYDHEAVFDHAGTRRHIARAYRVIDLAQTARSAQVQQFFGLIAMQAQVRGR